MNSFDNALASASEVALRILIDDDTADARAGIIFKLLLGVRSLEQFLVEWYRSTSAGGRSMSCEYRAITTEETRTQTKIA